LNGKYPDNVELSFLSLKSLPDSIVIMHARDNNIF